MPWFPDVSYELIDFDLVRFTPSSIDTTIANRVTQFSVMSDRDRDDARRDLDSDDVVLLMTYARRRALTAWRSKSLSIALEAIDANCVFRVAPDIERDRTLKLALFVARLLGIEDETLRERCHSFATDKVAREFDQALEQMDRVDTVDQIGYVVVETTHGQGLLELPGVQPQSEVRRLGIYGAPILHSNVATYGPNSNLAALAAHVADAVELGGRWRASPLTVATLASEWFNYVTINSVLATTGCLSFSLGRPDNEFDEVEIWLAELTDDDDAEAIANDPDIDVGSDVHRLVLAANQRLAVISTIPSFDAAAYELEAEHGDDDGDSLDQDGYPSVDLSEFATIINEALADPTCL